MAIDRFVNEYRFLSNFFPAKVKLDGVEYHSVEHAYQAAKTLDPNERAQFKCWDAAVAKKRGRTVTLRPDWDQVKYNIMLNLVSQKFEDKSMWARLVATGNEELIEGNHWHDTYWGRCTCAKHQGKGENKLGQILMAKRAELLMRDEENAPTREQSAVIYDFITGKEKPKMQRIYTGIGSRETPSDILDLMNRIAVVLNDMGFTLRSGHAPGADQAFENGCAATCGKMEIFLPWEGFENAPRNDPRYLTVIHPEAEPIAKQFHPAWDRCSQGAKKLHTRNVHQVLGADLSTKSDFIVCWTKDGKREGGTGQALRLAEYLHIPIFDLAVEGMLEELEAFIKEHY